MPQTNKFRQYMCFIECLELLCKKFVRFDDCVYRIVMKNVQNAFVCASRGRRVYFDSRR